MTVQTVAMKTVAMKTDGRMAVYADHRSAVARHLADGAYKPALARLLQLCRQFPTDPLLLDDMATCYWALGDGDTAMKLTEVVAQQLGTDAVAWGKLGAMALSTGQTARAQAAFETTLGLDPKQVKALAALNRIAVFDRSGHRAGTLRKIARSARAAAPDRATAFNALGRIEDAADNTRAAMFNFGKAKALSPGRFERDAVAQHVEAQAARFRVIGTDEGRMTQHPVFVVGMPRSGTTLVEHILLRHPEVGTVGETTALSDVLDLCRRLMAKAHGATGAWDWVDHLTDAEAAALRGRYLAGCAALFPGELPPVIVDKTPLNVFEIGFARRILPGARFVFLSRHPLDVGLSNFSTNFFAAHPFSSSLDAIGAMTRAVYRSAGDYQCKLGSAMRRQSYRALVTQPEAQIRALLDHLGLGWDAACLSPDRLVGIARTASVTQVRGPIGPSALDKWRRYERELAPLVASLGGWDWIDDWDRADTVASVRI